MKCKCCGPCQWPHLIATFAGVDATACTSCQDASFGLGSSRVDDLDLDGEYQLPFVEFNETFGCVYGLTDPDTDKIVAHMQRPGAGCGNANDVASWTFATGGIAIHPDTPDKFTMLTLMQFYSAANPGSYALNLGSSGGPYDFGTPVALGFPCAFGIAASGGTVTIETPS